MYLELRKEHGEDYKEVGESKADDRIVNKTMALLKVKNFLGV